MRDATIGADNRATNDPTTAAGALFGTVGKSEKEDNHPSRLIVRDAEMDMTNADMLKDTDLPYTESKTEVTIDRITAKAMPRTIERVPAGVSFNVNMVINIFDGEDESKLLKTLNDAMALLEDDYLGGNGSRGYGQVEFSEMKFTPKTYAE